MRTAGIAIKGIYYSMRYLLLVAFFLLSGCSNKDSSEMYVVDAKDYAEISQHLMGELISSAYLSVRVSQEISKDEETRKTVVAYFKSIGLAEKEMMENIYDLIDPVRLSEGRYMVFQDVKDSEVRFILKSALIVVIEEYNEIMALSGKM